MEVKVAEELWGNVVVPEVLCLVSAHLSQRDVCSLLSVNTSCHVRLSTHTSLCKVLDLRGVLNAGERLVTALSLVRYKNVEEINLEFARDVEDHHLRGGPFKNLRRLNLNACQKITDDGITAVASSSPRLQEISIYWNMKVTDRSVESLVKFCKELTSLNLSGCKYITDASLTCLARHNKMMKSLNLTRCVKLTDDGLLQLLDACDNLQELYLYAIPSFTDTSFKMLYKLHDLILLDMCGAQHLTDIGLKAVAECRKLTSLNLTWCVRVTDAGLVQIAKNCTSLQVLSLYGLRGVTDVSLEMVSQYCAHSLTTLDVNGCVGIKRRSKSDLLHMFPHLTTFSVHS